MFVSKDDEGDAISLELDQMEELAQFSDLDGEVGGLVGADDLDHVAAGLPENNSALVIVWEDAWARPFVEAVQEAGGVVIESARVPRELVDSAMAELDEALTG